MCIRERILFYQNASTSLEPNKNKRDHLLQVVAQYSDEFLNDIESLPAYQIKDNSLIDLKLNEVTNTEQIEPVIELIDKSIHNIGINPASPGHLGYIPGGGLYSSSLGDYMASVFNKYAGLYYASPGAVTLENKIIRWCADLIGYPITALGNITSGGSIANLIALCTARDHHQIVGAKIKKAVIYYSQQTHHCVNKAAKIAGLEQCVFRQIDLDHMYRMDATKLSKQIDQDQSEGLIPFFLAASCGSTDTGAVDQFDMLYETIKDLDIWYHIDAAYGGFFMLTSYGNELFKGINQADSVVLDPHKSLFLPYGTGIVLIRNGKHLFDSFNYTANYLQDANGDMLQNSPADLSPELTKHFRGLRIWLPLKLHGVAAFRASLDEKILLTQYLHEKLKIMGFVVGPKPQLTVCIYRYPIKNQNPNSFNQELLLNIQKDGRIFISSTTIDDKFWLRAAIVSFRTHLQTIDLFLSILKSEISKMLPNHSY